MRIKIYFLMFSGTLGIPYKIRLLHVSPPASVPSQSSVSAWARPMPGEVTDRRIWTGGSSRGLSAARPLLSADWGCCRLRSSEPACTALSSIKQVVRLSHNFIVHFSPAAGHGAGRNQQVSPGKRDKRHLEDGLTVAEEKVWRAHQLEFLAAQKCWGSMCVNACKLHTFTYMPAAMRNIQGRTDPKPDAWKASLWSWSNPTPANYPPKFTISPPCSSLLTINPDWAVRREGRVQQGRWGVVVTSEGPSSAPSCLHPCRLLGGMESKFVVELQSWGWRRLCYERRSVCVLGCLREKFHTFRRPVLQISHPASPPLVDVGWGTCFQSARQNTLNRLCCYLLPQCVWNQAVLPSMSWWHSTWRSFMSWYPLQETGVLPVGLRRVFA